MGASTVFVQSASELVREAVPTSLVPVFLAITRLGNPGLFALAFTLDYWFGDHERGAHAVALLVAGMALITALKNYFAVPRPPASITVVPITGYSFPSGHAMGSAIAYGILAHDSRAGSVRLRYALAGLLVVLVALSRVVLGVHYVRDVVAGVGFGLAFLAVALAVTGHAPRRGFALALGLAAVALLVGGFGRDAVVVAGVAIGAAAVWEALDPVARDLDVAGQVALVGVGVPVLAAGGYVAIRYALPTIAVFGVSVAVAAGILGAPSLAAALEERYAGDGPR